MLVDPATAAGSIIDLDLTVFLMLGEVTSFVAYPAAVVEPEPTPEAIPTPSPLPANATVSPSASPQNSS
jgi:hypothetical protein